MQILVVTDAWFPQVNGVVRTLDTLSKELERLGNGVSFLTPDLFPTVPCPTYPEIRLALPLPSQIRSRIDEVAPSAIHIATEGPLGWAARRYCLRREFPFTTSFHTHFPEYLRARWSIPTRHTYAVLRRFHAVASQVMVSTASLEATLRSHGFARLCRWSRGVDTSLFRPRDKSFLSLARPVSLYVGRVAVEKSVEDFLRITLPGTKVVVGDGPQLAELRQRYPDVVFAGVKLGEELARYYAAADVFVFPSRTDTFGLVLLEALASGVPVAAYPVPGPLDVIDGSQAGFLHADLATAIRGALTIPPETCRRHAEAFSWENSARQFLANLQVMAPATGPARSA